MPVHIAIPEPASPRFVEDSASYNARSLPQYLHALISAGATPIPIPLHESPQRVARILSTCHGILLPGSPADVDPQKYGEARNPHSEAPDPDRAAVDELLLQDAFNLRKPVLGICQGAQALNVWLGGTLIQDIPTQTGTQVNHSPGRSVLDAHAIEITPRTRLALIAENSHPERMEENCRPRDSEGSAFRHHVNSSHHQAVATLGDNLIVSALSPEDRVVEAIELASTGPDAHFVVAVQWHPERSYNQRALSRAIFAALVHAAEDWSPRKIEESVVHA